MSDKCYNLLHSFRHNFIIFSIIAIKQLLAHVMRHSGYYISRGCFPDGRRFQFIRVADIKVQPHPGHGHSRAASESHMILREESLIIRGPLTWPSITLQISSMSPTPVLWSYSPRTPPQKKTSPSQLNPRTLIQRLHL